MSLLLLFAGATTGQTIVTFAPVAVTSVRMVTAQHRLTMRTATHTVDCQAPARRLHADAD